MKKKLLTFTIISLSACTMAMATEYKDPKIEVRDISPSYKQMKAANFEDEYKMEGPAKADRQIASDKENSDREPSSLPELKKRNVTEIKDEKEPVNYPEPKEWLFKQDHKN